MKNLNIYIASRWKSQARLREICARLEPFCRVTSTWIFVDRPEDPTPEFFKEHGILRAASDIDDINRAEWLVLDLLEGRGRRGGMMFEAGYALAAQKRVVLIGDADCVFTQLFQQFDGWDKFIVYLMNGGYLCE